MSHATSFSSLLFTSTSWPTAMAMALLAGTTLNAGAQTESGAASPPAASAEAASEPGGRDTRKWLDSQAGRKQASTTRQVLSGPVMEKVHQRYVNSFAVPVPERLRENMSTTSGGK